MIAKRRHFTLVFDEFQNFKFVNESFFSEMQNIWDSNKDNSKINLIVCGSLYSMMTKIFDDRKEPLYGRATSRIRLRQFPLATIREILHDNNPHYAPDDLLTMYMITGGVAKYIEIDLIAVNEADHHMVIGEVKRNPKRIDLHKLEEKSTNIIRKLKDWKIEYVALSLDDMQTNQKPPNN